MLRRAGPEAPRRRLTPHGARPLPRPARTAQALASRHVGATGAFDDPDAAFDLFINGAFFERWHPDVPCAPLGGPYVPPVRVERRLEPAVLEGALDGQVRVELRATATACRCSQDDTLLIELQNRTRRSLGLMRDDDVCASP